MEAISLARAFTKRNKRVEDTNPIMGRSCTVRYTPGTISRGMISLPTELLSTTNVHALNAPDIRKVSAKSSSSSVKSSGSESEFSSIDKGFLTADNSSIGSSPGTPMTPANDESKDFFNAKPVPVEAAPAAVAPVLPKRAPSHSKQAHVELSRKRSIQRMSPPPNEIAKPAATRNSHDFFGPQNTDPNHPFGRELAQVTEMAEEFGASSVMLDEEEQEMIAKGLCKFSASDYLFEIAPLYGGVFENRLDYGLNPWI